MARFSGTRNVPSIPNPTSPQLDETMKSWPATADLPPKDKNNVNLSFQPLPVAHFLIVSQAAWLHDDSSSVRSSAEEHRGTSAQTALRAIHFVN